MQGLTKFFHHMMNPHCEECFLERERERQSRLDEKECKACETLRMQLESATAEKRMLLDALTRRDVETVLPAPSELPIQLPSKHIPWRVKQQILEQESRQAAAILKQKMNELNPEAPRLHVVAPSTPAITTEELEKEMDLVEEEREGESNVR